MGLISGSDARAASTISQGTSFISGETHQSFPAGSSRNHDNPGDDQIDCIHPFEAFVEELRRELAPRSLLERVLVDRVILSAWTLHAAGMEELAAIRSRSGLETGKESGTSRPRPSPRGAFFVADCLGKSLNLLRRLREDDQPQQGRPDPAESKGATPTLSLSTDDAPENSGLSNEWPVIPRGRNVASDPDPDAPTEEPEKTRKLVGRWQDRLVFDVNVSEHSPVVKGTWVTVSHVISLIVDGWTWSDILRSHPELNVDDIRTCLSYTVAESNDAT